LIKELKAEVDESIEKDCLPTKKEYERSITNR
jgi:hypothetical protein